MEIKIKNKTNTGADVDVNGKWSYYVSGEHLRTIQRLILLATDIAIENCSSMSNLKVKIK